MANKFQVKRTSTSGVTPNTTNVANSAYIAPGEFAVNMADSKLFTANTSGGLLELGSNLTNLSVTNTISISTAFVANSSGITGTLLTASQPNITANNSTNFGGQPASYYTNASNISTGTLAFARLPALYLGTTAIQSTSAAQAVSGITTLAAGNTTVTGFVNATSSVNSAVLAVGTNFVANTLGAYHTGTVNAASHTIGTTLVANTLGVYHTGTINAASHTVGTATVANSIGVFTTGTVNAATVSVGTNFITNTTLTTLGSNTVVNNNQQFRYQTVNTSAFAYFIQQNDDNFVFYTTNTAYGARAVWSIFANSITSAFTISAPATFNGNVTLGTVAVSANGATGTAGQVLTTNGTSTYWATPTAAAVINVAAQYAWTNTHSFAANVSFSNNIGLATNTALYFNTTTDANWRLGRNTGATTKWTYTGNTIDIIAASSTGEGITFGLNGGNSYFETGYLGTYIASNATIGNSSIKTTINGTSFSGTANNSLYLGGTAAASYALLSGAVFTGAVSGITTLAAGNTNITGYINASSYGSFDYITTANNGNGTNIKIGDDAWFGDINTADTVSIRGQQSANNGYIVFGNADTTSKLGRAGTGALTYTGAFAVGTTLSAGNTTITGFINATSHTTGDGGTGTSGGSTSNTTTYLVGNSSIFTTVTATGLFTSQGNGTFSIGNTTNRPAGFFNSVTGGSGSFTTLTSTATTTNVTASSFTTGSIVLGGTTQTGSILLGQSTANQTLSIANGATTSGNVKIVQIGTGGLSGSNTQITLGTTTGQSNVIVSANLAAFSANVSVAGTLSTTDLTVSGNLTVSGTTTYINTTTLNVGDNIITLNADLTGATAPTENAGIEINRGSSANVQFLWDETNDRWSTNGQPLAISSLATGNTTITGDLSVTGNTTLGDAATDSVTINANTITIAANANIDAGTLYIDTANNKIGISNTTPGGTLTLNGNIQIYNTTSLRTSSLGMDDNYNLKINHPSGYIQLMSSGVGVGNAASLGDYRFSVNGNTYLQGNTVVAGDFTVTGNTTLGDAATDSITINANTITIVANASIDAGTLYVDSLNNRVGVGTSTPGSILDVSGGQMRLTASGTWSEPAINAGILHYDSTNGDFNISARSNGGSTYFRFHTSLSGTGGERMRITANGNVGIGNLNPAYTLTVTGNDGAPGDLNGAFSVQASSNNSQRLHMGYATAGDYSWIESVRVGSDLRPLIFNPRGGNIGIGNTTPAAKLHVQGNVFVEGDDVNGSQLIVRGSTNSNNRLYIGYDTDDNIGRIQAITEGVAYRNLALQAGGGNVAIGNTAATNKLFITGDIGLDGISVRDTATTTTTATTQITLFEYPIATYDSCDVIVKAVSGGARHTTKLLVTANSTVAIATEYGTLQTGSSLYTVDCDVSGSNTRIRITPASATSTVFKASYELITA